MWCGVGGVCPKDKTYHEKTHEDIYCSKVLSVQSHDNVSVPIDEIADS